MRRGYLAAEAITRDAGAPRRFLVVSQRCVESNARRNSKPRHPDWLNVALREPFAPAFAFGRKEENRAMTK